MKMIKYGAKSGDFSQRGVNPWDVKEGIALHIAHKEFQIAITSEKGAKIITKY